MPWSLVVAIPGVSIRRPIESEGLAAVGPSEPRYESICSSDQNIHDYLSSFSSPFGERLRPTLIIRDDRLGKVEASELTAFRNSFAIPTLIESRLRTHVYERITGVPFSELFDIYPIHPATLSGHVVIHTAVEFGMHRTALFSGQAAPVSAHPEHLHPEYDEWLMTALLALHSASNVQGKHRAFRNKVYRSLEFAYFALRAPVSHLGSSLDRGVPLSMWVSAFETLAHPGPGGQVGYRQVHDMIRRVPWHDKKLRRARYRQVSTARGKKVKGHTTLPIQTCGRLYRARNLYLHGAPLAPGDTEPRKRTYWGDLQVQIPSLFRCVLLHELATAGFGSFPKFPNLRRLFFPKSDAENEVELDAYREHLSHEYYEDLLFNRPLR